MNQKIKTICSYMFKGGVGKTTITSMLGFELSKYGKTLLIDADQQGNLSSIFLNEDEINPETDFLAFIKNLTENIQNEKQSIEKIATKVREENEEDGFKGLFILPTKENDDRLRKYLDNTAKEEPFALRMAFQQIVHKAEQAGFKYILFDLPPSAGSYEKITLSVVDEIIPIIEPEKFAMESLKKFYKEIIEKLNLQFGAKLTLKYLIVNKENLSKKAHQFYLEDIKSSPFKEIFEIKDSNAISSATTMQVVFQENNPKHLISKNIGRLAELIK